MFNHKCKLCLKTFANGKALGGHMRSHMLNLYIHPNLDMSRNPTARQRSKRVRRPESSYFVDQQNFHEFNIKKQKQSPEEVVAYCLMMLSRDKWTHEEENDNELESRSELELELEFESETDSVEEVVKVKQTLTKNSYRCDTCNKMFKSYQALGGHIASHKKSKLNDQFQHNNNVLVEDKVYECHVCFKVFASGQALGGHKRSHVISNQVVKESINLIDLNLPALSDDDD